MFISKNESNAKWIKKVSLPVKAQQQREYLIGVHRGKHGLKIQGEVLLTNWLMGEATKVAEATVPWMGPHKYKRTTGLRLG
jgi:hypothetical protein